MTGWCGRKRRHEVLNLVRDSIRSLSQNCPYRFAAEAVKGGFVVIVDKDIADVFQAPESIKDVLRALIATMPQRSVARR